MSRSPSLSQEQLQSPTLAMKIAIWVAWSLGAILFFSVGWVACAPTDPLGVVSLLYHASPAAMIVQSLGLSLIVAVAATIIAGRYLVDVGLFSACLGLVIVTLRGNTGDVMLFDAANQLTLDGLGLRLAGECFAWCIVVMATMLLTPMIVQWSMGKEAIRVTRDIGGHSEEFWMAGAGLPAAFGKWTGLAGPSIDEGMRAKLHAGTVIAVGLVVEAILLKGFASRATEHSQSLFVVAGGVGVGAYVAHKMFPVVTPLWTISGAMKLALLRYLIAWIAPGSLESPILLNSNPMLRVLPLHTVAGGVGAAVFMFWQMTAVPGQQIVSDTPEDQNGSKGA
ncbi:MAG: hypothetical protein ACPGXK_03570 [Phycisphaerae bacterium]